MDSVSWRKVKSLFFAASELEPSERQAFLDRAVGASSEIRKEVLEMLSCSAEAVGFLEQPCSPEESEPLLAVRNQFSSGDLLANRYCITRHIARGGMGEVYEAEDLDLGILIAIKAIRPEMLSNPEMLSKDDLLSRFKREIDLARRVTHPNIGRIYDFGRHRDPSGREIPFLTMELLLGETLADRIRRTGPIPVNEALEIIRDIAGALDAVHDCGIVHRDFKSSNVMLIEHNHRTSARVMDFGLARPTIGDSTLLHAAQIGGTPPYMAPEQFENIATPASDIYAIGVVMHEMLTGLRPSAVADSSNPPARGGGVPAVWARTIHKAISHNPADRFQTASELLASLENRPVPRKPGAPPLHGARHWSFAALACIAIFSLAAWWLRSHPLSSAAASPPRHLAILPIQADTRDPIDLALCSGLSDTIRGDVAEIETAQNGIWVIPANEVRDLHTAQEAQRRVGANIVLETSFHRTPFGLSLRAELIDANNDRVLRSQEIQASDPASLHEKTIPAVAGMLGLSLRPETARRLVAAASREPGAFELYEEGQGFLQVPGRENTDRAISLFSRAVARDARFALAYAGLGEAYALEYSLTRDPSWIRLAQEKARKAKSLNSGLAQVHSALGGIFRITGQPRLALAELNEALRIQPACGSCLAGLAQTYVVLGRDVEAEQCYRRMIDHGNGSWIAFNGLAALDRRRGRLSEAAALYSRVVDLAPDNEIALTNLGGIYLELGRYQDAVPIFERVLRIQPGAQTYSNLGAALMYLKRFPEAVEAMEHAVQIDPRNTDYWRNLGDSYRQVPELASRAAGAYRTALMRARAELAFNPHSSELLSSIGLYYAHLGERSQALQFVSRAVSQNPPDSEVFFTSALALELAHDRRDALRYLEAARKAGFSLNLIESEPEFSDLRKDLRYQIWMEHARHIAPQQRST